MSDAGASVPVVKGHVNPVRRAILLAEGRWCDQHGTARWRRPGFAGQTTPAWAVEDTCEKLHADPAPRCGCVYDEHDSWCPAGQAGVVDP